MEVMIVLAVSSAMLVAVILAFSGRQARVEFTQAVRNFEGTLQTVISDVSAGYYRSEFGCTANLAGPPVISAITSSDTGTNSGCIFVGKILNPNQTSSVIHTVVGRRNVPGNINVSSYEEARPIIADAVDSPYTHSFALDVRRIVSLSDGQEVHALGFMKPLSSLDASTGNRALELYGATQPSFTLGSEINLNLFEKLPGGALICLRGQNGQRAEISVGDASGQTTVFSTLDTSPQSGEPCHGT